MSSSSPCGRKMSPPRMQKVCERPGSLKPGGATPVESSSSDGRIQRTMRRRGKAHRTTSYSRREKASKSQTKG